MVFGVTWGGERGGGDGGEGRGGEGERVVLCVLLFKAVMGSDGKVAIRRC